jgi:hypothetical protein
MIKGGIVRRIADRKEKLRRAVQDLVKGGAFKKGLVFFYSDVIDFWESLVDVAAKEVFRIMKMKSISGVPSRSFIWSVVEEVGEREFENFLKKSKVDFAMVYDMHKWVMVRTGVGFVGSDISQKAIEDIIVYKVRKAVERLLQKK